MSRDRKTVRLLFPPLAAAALVALTVTPSLAGPESSPAISAGKSSDLPATGHASTQTATPRAGNVAVGIPAVAFTETVVAKNGHLRAPLLINIAEVPGRVTVVGAGQGNDCLADAEPGVVLWLDCTVEPRAAKNPRIRVTLNDGRRVEKSISFDS